MKQIILLSFFLCFLSANARSPFKTEGNDHPFSSFFNSPIKSVYMCDIDWGCISPKGWEYLQYEETNDSVMAISEHKRRYFQESDTTLKITPKFTNTIKKKDLEKILKEIDEKPYASPSKEELNITQSSLGNYDMSQWEALPDSSFKKAIYSGNYSTYTHLFLIQIANRNNDTIHILSDLGTDSSLALPWCIFYKKNLLINANINLLKFIDSSLPEKFSNRHVFKEFESLIMAKVQNGTPSKHLCPILFDTSYFKRHTYKSIPSDLNYRVRYLKSKINFAKRLKQSFETQ